LENIYVHRKNRNADNIELKHEELLINLRNAWNIYKQTNKMKLTIFLKFSRSQELQHTVGLSAIFGISNISFQMLKIVI